MKSNKTDLNYFIKMFSNSILHNIVGTDLTKAKYFRDMYLLITALQYYAIYYLKTF